MSLKRMSQRMEILFARNVMSVIDRIKRGLSIKSPCGLAQGIEISDVEAFVFDLECVFGGCAYEPSERGAGVAFTDDIKDEVMDVLFEYGVIKEIVE